MINLLCEKERGLQMGRKSKSLPLFITAALIWFGYHCGAGFASGRQVWLYAAQYGTIGIAAPLIIWVLNASFMYISAEYARLKNATNSETWYLSTMTIRPLTKSRCFYGIS